MKKLGALAGMVVRIWPARLVSITARVVNRVRPSPSATTSRPVWAPGGGGWRARAGTADGAAAAGATAIQRISPPSRVSSSTQAERRADEAGGEGGLARVADGEAGDRGAGGEHDREQARQPGRRSGSRSPPEQGRRRHGPGAGERHQREDGGDQQAVGGAGQQRRPVERQARRHRQGVAGDERRPPRERARRRPGPASDRAERDQADLDEIGAEDGPAGRRRAASGSRCSAACRRDRRRRRCRRRSRRRSGR